MSTIRLDAPLLPSVESSPFGKRALELDAKCRGLAKGANGRVGALRAVNWERLEAQLFAELDAGELSLRTRLMVPAILPRLGLRVSLDAELQHEIDRACLLVADARLWPAQAWALLTWGSDNPRIRDQISTQRSSWPDFLQKSQSLLMELDLGGPVGGAIADHVVAQQMCISRLTDLDYLPPGSPLHRAVWQRLLSPPNRAWLKSQPLGDLGQWLERHKGQEMAALAVNTLLSPYTTGEPSTLDFSVGSELELLMRTGALAFRSGQDGLQLRRVGARVAALFKRWQALRDLEALLAEWGGSADRKEFWRSHRGRLSDTRWFSSVGYLCMQFGNLWLFEHESGKRLVVAVDSAHVAPFLQVLQRSKSARQADGLLQREARNKPQASRTRTFDRIGAREIGRWVREGRL